MFHDDENPQQLSPGYNCSKVIINPAYKPAEMET